MKKYKTIDMEIVEFDTVEVISTSGEAPISDTEQGFEVWE